MDAPAEPAPRQLIVCCDGTNNNLTGGASDTNVVKLVQLLARSPLDAAQTLFYDPGVGNAGELPGATVIDQWNRMRARIAGLAFGRGIYENLAQCYVFLMRHYRPGDQIFIFGFSRGAFTARSLAGLVNQFGVLRPHADSMVETLIHIYFSDRESEADKFKAIADQASALLADEQSRAVEMQFVGVWDTVASVGLWPFHERISATPTIVGKRYRNVRQALALDEHRAQFKPRLYADDNGRYKTRAGHDATLQQLWFRGSHCDVGGGYPTAAASISDQALAWIVSEAVQCGLRLQDEHGPLATEAAVLQAVARLPLAPGAARATARPRVDDMLRRNCLWALTGMAVRSTMRVDIHERPPEFVTPVEHASVADPALRYPDDTAWHTRRKLWLPMLATVLGLLLALVIGWLQTPAPPLAGFWRNLAQLVGQAPTHFGHNLQFQWWQLTWMFHGGIRAGAELFASPRWAVVLDLLLVFSYAYVLSWLAVAGFARRAGLRRVGDPVSTWLNLLGWALPVAVFADVLEDLATWLALTAWHLERPYLAMFAGLCMTLLTVAKIVGLVGSLTLALGPGRRQDAAGPDATPR
jgi:hypothetical protein